MLGNIHAPLTQFKISLPFLSSKNVQFTTTEPRRKQKQNKVLKLHPFVIFWIEQFKESLFDDSFSNDLIM